MKSLLPLLLALPVILASPVKRAAAPTVTIASPAATIIGSTGTSVESFNGIPFAKPPTGTLRLKPPQSLTAPLGTVTATGIARACPQFFFGDATGSLPTEILGTLLDLPLFQTITNVSRLCQPLILGSKINANTCHWDFRLEKIVSQ
jgi:Carboxylesterase family